MFNFPAGITILEDNVKANSSCILDYLLTKIQCDRIHVLCLEKCQEKLRNLIKNPVDFLYYKDPRDWKNFSLNTVTKLQDKSTVIIYSINQLAALTGWNECIQIINYLKSSDAIKNIFIVLHTDCLVYGIKMITHLKYISQSYIIFKSIPHSSKYFLSIRSKLPGGKLKSFNEEVFYNNMENKWISKEIFNNPIKVVKTETTIPDELASFKISIEGSAKAVKDGMVLPYTEAVTKESKIIYHHDIADDWDDEDPDDDLDI